LTEATRPCDVTEPHRRLLLKGLVCWPVAAAAQTALPQVRSLSLQHLHTDERLAITYFSDGSYLPQAIAEIERVLRDFRTGESHPIDIDLLDTLHALVDFCGGGAVQVICGYRSPATNAQLQATTEGVAPNSLHMEGRAVDVRLRGCDTARLRDAALALGRGGVGYYPQSDFIHLDTGRVRHWVS
jgi:uncharacterized protein YcbK (DUF882 family)